MKISNNMIVSHPKFYENINLEMPIKYSEYDTYEYSFGYIKKKYNS